MHTLKRLIRPRIPILIRMRQQTQLPVRLLDVPITTRHLHFLEAEDVVEVGGFAPLDSYHRRFLLDGEGAAGAAVVVAAVFRVPVGRAVWLRAGGFGRHGGGG